MNYSEIDNAVSMLPGIALAFQYTCLFLKTAKYAALATTLSYIAFCFTAATYHTALFINSKNDTIQLLLSYDLFWQRTCAFLCSLFIYQNYSRARWIMQLMFLSPYLNLQLPVERFIGYGTSAICIVIASSGAPNSQITFLWCLAFASFLACKVTKISAFHVLFHIIAHYAMSCTWLDEYLRR